MQRRLPGLVKGITNVATHQQAWFHAIQFTTGLRQDLATHGVGKQTNNIVVDKPYQYFVKHLCILCRNEYGTEPRPSEYSTRRSIHYSSVLLPMADQVATISYVRLKRSMTTTKVGKPPRWFT